MSFFGDDAVLVDERPRETVAEGVHVARRSLLRLSVATVTAGLAAACSAPAVRETTAAPVEPGLQPLEPLADGSLDLAGFLTELQSRANAFVASDGAQEERYLMAVGELMTRLVPPTPADTRSGMKAFQQQVAARGEALPIWVVQFDLDAGKGFSHHDHRDYNGVILGVGGEARVTNYDILGDELVPPKGETFQIRQTRDDLILPGRFSSLGTSRENVHELVAGPDGAVVLDVFTYLKAGARSYFMEVDPTPRDAERRIYDAAWS